MNIYEIGTGYTSIPARMGAATEIVVEELTKSLIKIGEDVQLIDIEDSNRVPNNLPITEVPMPSKFLGTDVGLGVMHKLKRIVYSISLTKKLHQIIKDSDEETILHFHNQYNMYFFLRLTERSLRKRVKIVYTVHSYIWPGKWSEIKDTIKKRYFQEVSCVKKADYVLVLNTKTAENLVKHLGVDKKRIHKIINGVNTEVYYPLSKESIIEFKNSIGIEDKKIIFQVGSVCERKNQLGTVKMLVTYLKNNSDVVYMYAGGVIDEEYKKEIDIYAKRENISAQVKYVGELCPGEELNHYYNAAKLTVFPSKIESFGLVIIESISSGTPVLLSENPLFDLKNGYETFNSEAEFVNLVDRYMNGEKDSMDARTEVIKKYSWDKVAENHIKVIRGGDIRINCWRSFYLCHMAFQFRRRVA